MEVTMDITSTAQVAAPVVAATLPWWHYVVAILAGVFVSPFAKPAIATGAQKVVDTINSPQVKDAIKSAQALAPAAETVAILSGNPALAGGIEAANKVVDAIGKTTNPDQLAALAVVHAQTLAAAAAPAPTLAPGA